MHTHPTLDLAWLLQPMTSDQFFADTYEQSPHHFPAEGNTRRDTSQLFSWDAVETLMWQQREQLSEFVSLVKGGTLQPYHPHAPQLSRWLLQEYQKGATLSMRGIESRWVPAAALARAVEASFVGKVSINVYMSPANTQGTCAHSDGHDTLILQVEGSKRWQLYPTKTPLATEAQRDFPSKESLGDPSQSLLMRPGDVLYLPRGTIHEPLTEDEASLHLTIGLYPLRWVDLFKGLLERAELTEEALRRSVPQDKGQASTQLKELASGLADIMADPQTMLTYLEAHQQALVAQTRPLPGAFVQSHEAAAKLQETTLVEKRPGMRCHLRRVGNKMELSFPGVGRDSPTGEATQAIAMHRMFAPALAFLVEQQAPFCAQDLPEMPNNTSIALLQRLLREGLLQLASG